MDSDQNKEYEGFLLKVPASELETVEDRASLLKDVKILAEKPYKNHVNILISVPSYLRNEFLEPFYRSEIDITRINNRSSMIMSD